MNQRSNPNLGNCTAGHPDIYQIEQDIFCVRCEHESINRTQYDLLLARKEIDDLKVKASVSHLYRAELAYAKKEIEELKTLIKSAMELLSRSAKLQARVDVDNQ